MLWLYYHLDLQTELCFCGGKSAQSGNFNVFLSAASGILYLNYLDLWVDNSTVSRPQFQSLSKDQSNAVGRYKGEKKVIVA